MDNLSGSFTKYTEVHRKTPKTDKRSQRSLHQCCLGWLDEVIPSYDENPDWSSSLSDFETLYQQGPDPINFLSQVKQSHGAPVAFVVHELVVCLDLAEPIESLLEVWDLSDAVTDEKYELHFARLHHLTQCEF